MKESITINPLLNSIGEDVMGFLNEIQLKYPEAISLASGRPDENYFDLEDIPEYFNHFVDTIAESEKKNRQDILGSLGQYNRAKGIINEFVAEFFKRDEKIDVSPEDILITVGTQESMAIALMTLCDREKDVILVEDPSYIGITNFSMIAGYQMEPVSVDNQGISLNKLEEKVKRFKKQGKRVKVVYVIPDYQNPTGNSMPLKNKHRLLELARTYDFFIIEDNAYGEFAYEEGIESRTLKSLDAHKRVVYLRSFSKSLYPSLRLGAIIADQRLQNEGKQVALSDLMATTKGYLTVNTSSINQAIFGGILIKNKFSLKDINKEKVAGIKRKRNQLLLSLNKFLNGETIPWAKDISWNVPEGGFFITIRVPFNVGKKEVVFCAENHHVIFTPMLFFYLEEGSSQEIRLAFSHIPMNKIEPAIKSLANYIEHKIIDN